MLYKRYSPRGATLFSFRLWWREWLFFIFVALALGGGGFGDRLIARPSSTDFFEFFIKEGMLPLIIGCIFGYILLIKQKPQRLDEYRYLASLPLKSAQLADNVLVQELLSYAWLPAIPIFILWTLIGLAPAAHVCRLSVVMLLSYSLLFCGFLICAFIFTSSKLNVLIRYNPVLVFIFLFFFATGTTTLILLGALISGLTFWIIFGLLSALILLFWQLLRKAVFAWLKNNTLFRSSLSRRWQAGGFIRLPAFGFQQIPQPFLAKNLLKFVRENSLNVSVLTAIYILCGYLASRNNERIEDFIAILLTATVLYALFFSAKSQNYFSASIESTRIVYALPVRKRDLYFSIYLPAVLWLLLITFVFTLLAFVLKIGVSSGMTFWFKASGLSIIFVTAALNFAFKAYPDEKRGQSSFLYWGLVLLVLFALFYGFRYYVLLFMLFVSFIGMNRVRFFYYSRFKRS